ncbi:MAG: tRNA nucleotidyltransferase, partial [Firmicutes bacterium]|nr:tRNA nucleotidyltransferase [Bacillota bacterium]
TTDPKTMELYRHISLKDLSRERVEEELKKALLKGSRPSVFFEVLRECGQLEYWFSPLHLLPQLQQDPVYHPEGDVWIHTMQVLDRGAAFRGQVSDPYAFLLLCLTHDLGKLTTTAVGKDGRIHAYGHEAEGLSLIEEFLRRFTADKAVIDYVLNMVPLHMKPNLAAWNRSALRTTNRLFDEAAAPKDLIYFAMADKPVMSFDTPFEGDSAFLFQRYEDYLQVMERPYVAGRDLIEAGLSPGPEFKAYLEYAHKLRLAGIDKESALKQTLAMAGIKTKKEKKKHGRSADRKQ